MSEAVGAQLPSGSWPPRPTHSKDAARLAHGPAVPWVVHETGVAFRGAVDFKDPNGAEASLEGLPHVCTEPVAHRQADGMCPVLWSLQRCPKESQKEVPWVRGRCPGPFPGRLSLGLT